ncbi:MAG: DUF1302 domain-containing protein [Deltaproteobacteria bacterium]|nr:DUF1302 domain-containing protein [Deltaproteobacteria bacterium]
MKLCRFGGKWFQKLVSGFPILSVVAVLVCSSHAQAFQLYNGEKLKARLDSTVSYGLQWRVQDRDEDIIGIAQGGKFYSSNYDDGNLNYDTGLISNAIKITSDLEIDYGWIGAFFRATAFYDYENESRDRARTPLNNWAQKAVATDSGMLDAYVWASHDIGEMPVQLRLGDQVVSWGESTFIQGGINIINPVDVAKIRVPGAELKEALVPEGIIYANVSPTETITLEGLYLYDWEETKIDEPGTYFAGADFPGRGGVKLMLGGGFVPDNGDASAADTFMALPRDPTKSTSKEGQYGVAMRYYASWLNDTEIGFYYLNYHERLPRLEGRTGTMQGLMNAGAAAAAVIGAGGTAAQANAVAIDAYAKTGGYRTTYVEDRTLLGLGFSTELGGVAWQGEVSYRPDAALQIDDVELLLSFFGPLDENLGNLSQLGATTTPDTLITGYIERDMTQVQSTGSYLLPPIGWLGSDGGVALVEVGWIHVIDMPKKSELRLEGPGAESVTPGNATAAGALGTPQEDAKFFADQDSWGYRVLAQLDYFNAIGAVGLSPRIAFEHDVSGNSPFGGSFLENRKAVTLGLTADYRSAWSADISYTNFFGAGRHNLINDRDFIGFNIKYSF